MPKPQLPHLKQYHAQHRVEDTALEQAYLDQMLSIMAFISRDHHPVGDDYHCRGIVWIKNEFGQNHLITTASVRGSHVEELLIKAIADIYKYDFAVVKNDKLNVHRMYIDIAPCDGERYGKGHHCMEFFKDGRKIKLHDGTLKKISISDRGIIYWNIPLPPKSMAASARSKDVERDQCLLGVTLDQAFKTHHIWEKLYIADENGYKEFDIKAAVKTAMKSDEETDKIKEVKKTLNLLLRDVASLPFDKDTCELLTKYHTEKNENKLNLYARAIAENWRPRQIINNNLTLQDATAIEELQRFMRYLEEKKKNMKPTSLASDASKTDKKPVDLEISHSIKDATIQKKEKEPSPASPPVKEPVAQSKQKRPFTSITLTAAAVETQDTDFERAAKRTKQTPTFFKQNNAPTHSSSSKAVVLGNTHYMLDYRYRQEDGPHQVVAFEDKIKKENIYELTFKSEPKKGSFNYEHFKSSGILILNCQFPPKSIVYLPAKMDCFIVAQDPSVKIKQYKGRSYQIIPQVNLEEHYLPERQGNIQKK